MILVALALQIGLLVAAPDDLPSPGVASPTASPDVASSAIPLGTPRVVRRGLHPLPVPAGAASIVNSGSTNLSGYQIVVSPNGTGQAFADGSVRTIAIPAEVAAKFFADLGAATPLDAEGAGGCMKSASFGSSTHVEWQGTTSADLSCGRSAHASLLETDIEAIVKAAGVQPHVRSRRMLL